MAGGGPDAGSCTLCGGTGFVVERSEDAAVAQPCRCRRLLADARRRAGVGIPRRYEHCTLDQFDPLNDSLRTALAYARRVVESFPGSDFGLLFTGPCGVGKTHLAVAVLRELVEHRGARGLFAEVGDLLRRLVETYDRRSQVPSWEVLEPALEADVLLLDDLGATRMTPWMQDTVGLIINERYNEERLTLITTNRPMSSGPERESLADRIGERLASRLTEMCVTVRMEGEDFRRKIKAAEFR
ncbi:MAG: AAA family ATPase [Acidobacteria bacterium]|nr:MAG: AAA family ATPase [Acidobacteriota bacterium]